MSERPPASRGVAAADLAGFVAALFVAKGFPAQDAATIADVLVWADLRGVDSHGVERIPSYMNLIAGGQMNPTPDMRLDDVAPAAFRIDSDRAAGPVPMLRATDEAVARAKTFGVAMGLVARCAHSGAVGYYVERAARAGCVGIVFGSGPPLMAYHGARVASLSTSPLAIAVPGGRDGVTLLDMASAVAANGKLKQAQRENKPIPEGWALDKAGEPTTDPAAAAIALPIGGPKGAGLGLMFECVTSVLAGAPLLATMLGAGRKFYHMQSEMILAVDVSRFRARADFESDVVGLTDILRDLPRAQPDEPIRMPGERAAHEARRRSKDGVPLGARLRKALAEAARGCGVEPPAFLA